MLFGGVELLVVVYCIGEVCEFLVVVVLFDGVLLVDIGLGYEYC